MKSYDRHTLQVCATPEYAVLAQNPANTFLVLELVKLIAKKTALPIEQVVTIITNELAPEGEE